jgi:prefoldin alpha subunit
MVEQKELQEKLLTYRILEARLNSLLKQREMILNKLAEIQSTLASIDEIEKSDNVLFSIGSEAYTLGKIIDKKNLIVEVGANVALEKTIEEGKETLNKRRSELESGLNSVQKEMIEISVAMEKLGPEIQKLGEKITQAG